MVRSSCRVGVAALALTLAACSGNRLESPFDDEGAQSIRIDVENLNFADATLHARRGGQRVRLGVVSGKTDQSFEMPWTFSLQLQVEIDLLAGPACVTRPLQVDPGDVILLRIEPVLTQTADRSPL